MDGTSHLAPERFIEEARAALTESSRRLVDEWRLGSESRWEVDLKVGQVSFHFEDGTTLLAPIQVVGTYNSRDGTFLWAWGHKALPEHLVAHASLARAWGQDRAMAHYTTAIVTCTPDEVWNFAAVTARLAGREGIYRGRSGSVWLYLTYGTIEMQAPHRADAAGAARSAASASTSAAGSTDLVDPGAGEAVGPRVTRTLGRFSSDVGEAMERGLLRLQTRISDAVQRPIDCARVTSKLRLSLARRRGQLAALELLPARARVGRDEGQLNTVFVPPYFAEQKRRIDQLVTAGLVRHGMGSAGFSVTPDFAGRSLVPASIHIDVAGAAECWVVLRIWEPDDDHGRGDDDGADGPDTVALNTGPYTGPYTEPYTESFTEPHTEPRTQTLAGPQAGPAGRMKAAETTAGAAGGASRGQVQKLAVSDATLPGAALGEVGGPDDPISEGQPRSIVEAFIRDYFEWNLDAVEGGQRLDDTATADREEQVLREYRKLLSRYCANGVRPGAVSFGADSRFDPSTSRIVAEAFFGNRALVVVGCPDVADQGQFSTYDFEFALDADRWLLIDIAVVDGFDRLSMLHRQRSAALRAGEQKARLPRPAAVDQGRPRR